MRKLFVVIFLMGFETVAWGNAGEVTSVQKVTDAVAPAPIRTVLDDVVLESNALAPLTPSPNTSPALSLKGEGERSAGEGWGLEIGSILPHNVADGFDTANQTEGSTSYYSRLASFYEIHAAAIHALPHGNQEWAVPEIGLGLSLLHMSDNTQTNIPVSGSYTSGGQTYSWSYIEHLSDNEHRWSVSPLVRLGVVLFPQSLISVRTDVAYVGYSNTAHSLGQTFDLGLSGMMVEESLQVRL